MIEERAWKAAGLAVAIGIAWGLFANAEAQRMATLCQPGPVRMTTNYSWALAIDHCHEWWGIPSTKAAQ